MNESQRLALLKAYKILDTATEKSFDDLVKLAAHICSAPMSAVSLIDEDRQWFKSKEGIEERETSREDSFCQFTIQQDEVLVIENAESDERVKGSALVCRQGGIRFYAGAPLITKEGASLGALCVLDTKPRSISDTQIAALKVLRDAVVTQLEHRKALQELEHLEKLLPMCAWCHSVRTEENGDDPASWVPIQDYVSDLAPLTHGICPECKNSYNKDKASG